MGLKEEITNLLKIRRTMTQCSLAESIYGDRKHSSNIYGALTSLVKSGEVFRPTTSPSTYALKGTKIITTKNDVSKDVIINRTLEEVEQDVARSDYGLENDLITSCLNRFPLNVDRDVIAMKIGLIDITNSTHLSQHKSKINMADLSEKILSIHDIDRRISIGDPTVVNDIAKNENINLFSFASKYCCYHNRNLYGKDDYSIFDNVLKESLPLYFNDISEYRIDQWRKDVKYQYYNKYITEKLDSLNITVEYRRRKFDHFVWFRNRREVNKQSV